MKKIIYLRRFTYLLFVFTFLFSYNLKSQINNHLENENILDITEDLNGNIWAATAKSGVVMINGEKNVFYNEENNFICDKTYRIYCDSKNNIWVLTGIPRKGKGLAKYNGNNWVVFTKDQGLPSLNIWAFYEDCKGIIWVCTDKGAAKLVGNNFTQISADFPRPLPHTICEDKNGNVILTEWARMIVCNSQGSKEIKLSGKTKCTISLAKDKNGDLWFSHFGGYYSKYENENLFLQEKRGGTYYGNSIMAPLVIVGVIPGLLAGFVTTPQDHPNYIFFDSKNNMWFSGLGSGARLYKKSGNSWIEFTKADGVTYNKGNGFLEDGNGNVWFSTKKGANFYNGNGWKSFTTDNGLINNCINKMFMDSKKNLWFATKKGLTKYK